MPATHSPWPRRPRLDAPGLDAPRSTPRPTRRPRPSTHPAVSTRPASTPARLGVPGLDAPRLDAPRSTPRSTAARLDVPWARPPDPTPRSTPPRSTAARLGARPGSTPPGMSAEGWVNVSVEGCGGYSEKWLHPRFHR